MSGTPLEGMSCTFEYKATPTTGGNSITFLGTTMPSDYTSKKVNIDAYYNGSAWIVDYQPAFDESDIITTTHIKNSNITEDKLAANSVTSAKVKAGELTNSHINASAAIATSKLAAATDIAKIATVTQAELEYNHGVTPGTASASKSVILDSNGKINTLNITELVVDDTAVVATASELNTLSGITSTTDDLNLLSGAQLAGVTASDIQAIKGFTDNKAKVNSTSASSDYIVDTKDQVIVVSIAATNITFTLPNVNAKTGQDITVIVKSTAGTNSLVFTSITGDTIYYSGTDAVSKTITTPAVNSIIRVVNAAAGVWVIGK